MTDNEKYVKCGQALIIGDDPQRHEEVMSANKNESGASFQYTGSPFAALAVVKSMTGLPYRHLQRGKPQAPMRTRHPVARQLGWS